MPVLKLLPITAVAQIYFEAGTLKEVATSSLQHWTPLGEQKMLKSKSAKRATACTISGSEFTAI